MQPTPSMDPARSSSLARTRLAFARGALRATATLSRRLGLGDGSTIGGRVGLAVDPGLLAAAGKDRIVALVSGTNGKTTTTRLLAAALAKAPGAGGGVASSSAGANLPAGLASALVLAPKARYGALEVDESYLGQAIEALDPAVVVLLNLSRDQLDRVSEVRKVASRWREALRTTKAVVVANADDPLVVWAASAALSIRYVAAGGLWRADAYHCPSCDARLELASSPKGGWSCGCGLARPSVVATLDDGALVLSGENRRVELSLCLPGRFNAANAALAAVAAEVLGVDLDQAVEAMRPVSEVAGRFATFEWAGARIRLLLAKNPAGFAELLALVGQGTGPVVVAVNARDADGHDPSWLWDVPFERLAGRYVLASGERRLDLAVRLRHALVEHEVADDPLAALAKPAERNAGAFDLEPGSIIEVIANYTAFQELRRSLRKRPGRARSVSLPLATSAPAEPTASTGRRPGSLIRDRPSRLRIIVVHPDLLGTYGDAGNGLVLANRARWRGLGAELVLAPSDVALPSSGDLYCIGGGEDGPQSHAAEVLSVGALERAIERGAAVLAVCAGFQILGTSFPGADGGSRKGLGLLDVDTKATSRPRAVGELLVVPNPDLGLDLGAEMLTGFENHAARTRLGPAATPLGRVLRGTGNDGTIDGAVQGRIIGTYLHGPALARNPRLADVLLGLVLGAPLSPLEDAEEQALRAERIGSLPPRRHRRPRIG
jgi:CobQ-like glutamine amidotransferase family enzyme/UDP-N-acetylmuramyl tripeptide synthase